MVDIYAGPLLFYFLAKNISFLSTDPFVVISFKFVQESFSRTFIQRKVTDHIFNLSSQRVSSRESYNSYGGRLHER
jgi:hypothetical protein